MTISETLDTLRPMERAGLYMLPDEDGNITYELTLAKKDPFKVADRLDECGFIHVSEVRIPPKGRRRIIFMSPRPFEEIDRVIKCVLSSVR